MNNMKVIKFGGTSLKTESDRRQVINILKEELKSHRLVVVVSAMGRFPDSYATDTLLQMVSHLTKKEQDEIMACGEMISSHLLCNECVKDGVKATCLNVLENGIITDQNYGNGHILSVNSNCIYQQLKEYELVIVPGFFGTNKSHFMTSLGRGGSDLSAVVIADGLGLKEVTIYSDVEGIYSADPKQISEAILYEHVNISQALALSDLNVPVIQKKACQWANEKKIKMILKSTFRQEGSTIVDEKGPYHAFIIFKEDCYYLMDKTKKLSKFPLNLSLNQAHRLFIS